MNKQRKGIPDHIQNMIRENIEKELLANDIPFIRSENTFNLPKLYLPRLVATQTMVIRKLIKDGVLTKEMVENDIDNYLDELGYE